MNNQNFPRTNIFRMLLSVAGSILFIFLGIHVFKNAENYDINPIISQALASIIIVFFGALIIWRVKSFIVDKK